MHYSLTHMLIQQIFIEYPLCASSILVMGTRLGTKTIKIHV